MPHTHPIGDEHPFPAVHALAQAEGYDALEMVNVYDGALIRLFCKEVRLVFKLEGDPGSSMDRQRFDYYTHVTLRADVPEMLLAAIRDQVADSEGAAP